MSETCLLCGLGRGEEPASVAYEDEHVVVVADLMPVNPGHVFVLPRDHVELVPRFRGDGFHLVKDGGWTRPQPRALLDEAAGRIREAWT